MTSASSIRQQALALQQEQLRHATALAAPSSAHAAVPATTVDTARRPQVGAALSSALSQLGSNESETTNRNQRLVQAIKSYADLGPSDETEM